MHTKTCKSKANFGTEKCKSEQILVLKSANNQTRPIHTVTCASLSVFPLDTVINSLEIYNVQGLVNYNACIHTIA